MVSGFGEDPVKPYYGKGRTTLDDTADVRDYLASLIGRGSKAMDSDSRSEYGRLAAMYGKQLADKIMNHVFIFNNRPDVQKAKPEERLDTFYTIGSQDPELKELFNKSKAFGYGPRSGFNQSSNEINQILSGRLPAPPGRAIPSLVKATTDTFR